MKAPGLHDFLVASASKNGAARAVEEAGDTFGISYGELDRLSDRLRDRLVRLGVGPGDRVGLCVRKTIDSLAAIFGILKTGAAYVPTDPGAPPARNAYILSNCQVKVAVLERRFLEALTREQDALGHRPMSLVLDEAGGGRGLSAALDREDAADPAAAAENARVSPDDLAYILYTSGSTGLPKGVMLTHRNAVSFVDWCSEVFEPRGDDRFSSHAPFHFDLSILDIYLPVKHGAALVLFGEELGKDPLKLAPLIAEKRLTVWYSTPSILSLLAQYGRLENHDLSALRTMLFAGEVFPVRHLRSLMEKLPAPRYYNLYGPTETNVCTFYEIPREIPPDRSEPFPVGPVCSHLRARVIDLDDRDVPPGTPGELLITGPGVTQGYWGLPERNAAAFLRDPDGTAWYRTGDIVIDDGTGCFTFVGRRDRMVKRRGYRVELGEIEAGLYKHSGVREAAVVAREDPETGVLIRAFLSFKEGERASIIELKRFCAENLPAYMVPDVFLIRDALPRTSTDKIDYQKLKEID